MVEVTIHFGRADARVQCEHIRGTSEAAETLAVAFVACGAQRVNRQVDADF